MVTLEEMPENGEKRRKEKRRRAKYGEVASFRSSAVAVGVSISVHHMFWLQQI